VLHSLDIYQLNRSPLNGGKQDAPERMPQGNAETALERLHDKLTVRITETFLFNFHQPRHLETF
jgi:hypothetical protein